MKFSINKFFRTSVVALSAATIFSACNKEPEQFPDIVNSTGNTGTSTIASIINSNPSDTLYKVLLVRAGLYDSLNIPGRTLTVWVPSDAAMRQFVTAASGGAIPTNAPGAVVSGFLRTTLPVANAVAIAQYNMAPGRVDYTTLASTFPNVQYPSLFNPMPSASALLRMTIFPSPRNGNFINNIPVTTANVAASNGIMHRTAAVNVPPSTFLWSRINTDPELTYLKAAIARADSGSTAATSLAGILGDGTNSSAIGANLTVYAPLDTAFKLAFYARFYPLVYQSLYGQAYQFAIGNGQTPAQAQTFATSYATANAPTQTRTLVGTPAVFNNPALYPYLSAQTVKGIVVYHVLGSRAFNNNLPTTQASFPTILNTVVPTHPGVGLQATFMGPMVSAATVKGVANPSASNILINPTPSTGSSDQNFLNGVLHKIDQVLFPM